MCHAEKEQGGESMTIEALDRRLSRAITQYTERIDSQYIEGDKPLTHNDAVEIAKETSDLMTLFKQEIIRQMRHYAHKSE